MRSTARQTSNRWGPASAWESGPRRQHAPRYWNQIFPTNLWIFADVGEWSLLPAGLSWRFFADLLHSGTKERAMHQEVFFSLRISSQVIDVGSCMWAVHGIAGKGNLQKHILQMKTAA